VFDGPSDEASILATKSWTHITAVRAPLNEACWNGESYVDSAYAGTAYQQAVENYVKLLNANGIVAILDLHWTDGLYTGTSSGCSSAQAVCQKPMPDAAEALPFWTSVAQAFKGNDAAVFDLFNEPYASRATGETTTGRECWLNGGTCPGIGYQVAGMQSMVDAVRSAGATNVLMLGGEEYANDLSQWLTYVPTDPDGDLVASWHSYSNNTCNTRSCWTSEVAPVIAKVPVVVGEMGEGDCAGTYIDPLATWLESENTGFPWSAGRAGGVPRPPGRGSTPSRHAPFRHAASRRADPPRSPPGTPAVRLCSGPWRFRGWTTSASSSTTCRPRPRSSSNSACASRAARPSKGPGSTRWSGSPGPGPRS
jgi:hypothetical protein